MREGIIAGVIILVCFICVWLDSHRLSADTHLDSRPHLALALALYNADRSQDAANEYRMAIYLNKWNYTNDAKSSKHRLAQCYMNLGVCYLEENNWQDAACCFYQAAKIDPSNIRAIRHNLYVTIKRAGGRVLHSNGCIVPEMETTF